VGLVDVAEVDVLDGLLRDAALDERRREPGRAEIAE